MKGRVSFFLLEIFLHFPLDEFGWSGYTTRLPEVRLGHGSGKTGRSGAG